MLCEDGPVNCSHKIPHEIKHPTEMSGPFFLGQNRVLALLYKKTVYSPNSQLIQRRP
jgi:hypothetical protein